MVIQSSSNVTKCQENEPSDIFMTVKGSYDQNKGYELFAFTKELQLVFFFLNVRRVTFHLTSYTHCSLKKNQHPKIR